MIKRVIFRLLSLASLAALTACGGGGGTPLVPPPTPTATPVAAIPFTATGPQMLTAVNGWTPSITIPAGSTPSSGLLGVKVGLTLRSGIPPLDRAHLRPVSSLVSRRGESAPPGKPVIVADFTLTNATNGNETLSHLPNVSIAAPTGTAVPACSATPCVYQAAFLGMPGTSGWIIVGLVTLRGQTLTFTGTGTSPLTLTPGVLYDLALYATSGGLSLSFTATGKPLPNNTMTFANPFISPRLGLTVSGGVPPYTAGTPSESGIAFVQNGQTPGEFSVIPSAAGTTTIPLTDSDGGTATLTVSVKCGPAPPGHLGGKCHLYVADFSSSKIITYPLPILVPTVLPVGSMTIVPSGAHPETISVDNAGDVFYVANDASFSNMYVGKCVDEAPNLVGTCSQIVAVPGGGAPIAASGIAINGAGTAGFVVYSTGQGATGPATGIIAPLSESGGAWMLGSPLSTIGETGLAPIFPGYPIASPYAGAALDNSGDLAVALPQGAGGTVLPSLAVFTAGALPATYYSFASFGNVAPIAAAWSGQPGGPAGSTTLLGLYTSLSSTVASSWGVCVVPGGTCAPGQGFFGPVVVVNAEGIAGDSNGNVYVSQLGTLGTPNPLPPVLGTQTILVAPPAGSLQQYFTIRNNASGEPFKTPWGLALGP